MFGGRRDYHQPELLATGPNQLRSWDITKLKGPQTWTYFYLYEILDVYSRYVVGWLVAERESATLADHLITETCRKQDIPPKSSPYTPTTAAPCPPSRSPCSRRSRRHQEPQPPLSATITLTRRRSSRPSSTAPTFPSASAPCRTPGASARPSSPGTTPEHPPQRHRPDDPQAVHDGQAQALIEVRSQTPEAAFIANPTRFKASSPTLQPLPPVVWINQPSQPPAHALAEPGARA